MARESEQQKKNLDSVTDFVQQLEVSNQEEQELKGALERLASKFKAWEEENKPNIGSVVNDDYTKVIVDSFEVTVDEAEDALRRNDNDLQKALVYLIDK